EDKINALSNGIKVQKYSFCCRLRKRTANHYDRPRTTDWFHCVLKNAFPEVQRLHRGQVENHLAVELTRTFFQQRHLNIRHALTKAGKSTVMLKGHVDVQE
ncbi:unnamed protein product, partial [Effrenium voratum]